MDLLQLQLQLDLDLLCLSYHCCIVVGVARKILTQLLHNSCWCCCCRCCSYWECASSIYVSNALANCTHTHTEVTLLSPLVQNLINFLLQSRCGAHINQRHSNNNNNNNKGRRPALRELRAQLFNWQRSSNCA